MIGAQTLGGVKNTQSKEYKKLKQQLLTQNDKQDKRKVSFNTSESGGSSDLPLELFQEKSE